MFDIWKNLKDLVHVNYRHVRSTNAVFIIHSKVTVIILVGLSILVTSRQYLGDPIDCISSPDIKNIADKYCWVHSTFTKGRLDDEGRWGYEAVEDTDLSPGIRPAVEGEDPRIYHTYYQWVWAVLFMQGACFFLPYWLWKIFDRGRIKMLVADLNLRVLSDEEKAAEEKSAILRYFAPNRGHHTLYAMQYIFCELLCAVNVLLQMYWTNVFLDEEFSEYGLNLFSLTQQRPYNRRDELSRVFPIVTACRLATGGPAFNTMEYDLLCILPINILNEKIYIFLWYWFILLATLSCLTIFYRILTLTIPPLRTWLLLKSSRVRKGYHLDDLKLSYGDWFLLHKVGDNLNPIVFSELLQEIVESVDPSSEEKKSLTKEHIVRRDSLKSNSLIEQRL